MLRSNADGRMLEPSDLRRRPKRAYSGSFSDFFDGLLFSPAPQGRVDVRQLNILGRRGSGKSSLIAHLAKTAYAAYPADLINAVYTDDHDVAVALMDDRPVQLVILDDAAGAAASRRAAANVGRVQDYNMIRHTLEERQAEAGRAAGGAIIVIVAWQRKNDLERAMREAEFQIWKTPPVEPEDRKALEDLIGARHMRILQDSALRAMQGDQGAKGASVGMVSALGIDGVGVYRSPAPDPLFRMPELVSAKKLAEARGAGGELRPPAGGPGPEEARRRMRREAAEMSARGMPMGAIAAALGKSKTTVHRWLKGAGGG